MSDLAPLRRMLGPHSMVIRVNADGGLMPFEILPELFLGRSIRQLLAADTREQFGQACSEVVRTRAASTFAPDGYETDDEVMITPILDSSGERCQFLVCWARRQHGDGDAPAVQASMTWADLTMDQVEVRYRTISADQIEAAPWWDIGAEGIDLWAHDQHVSSVGLGAAIMAEVAVTGIDAIADTPTRKLRINVPSAEMLDGLIQVFHGALRASGVPAERVVVGVPVELAVDPDLLPVIAHLSALGLQIDIVGLDALTAKLHRVSDTSTHTHVLPIVTPASTGSWTDDITTAVGANTQN